MKKLKSITMLLLVVGIAYPSISQNLKGKKVMDAVVRSEQISVVWQPVLDAEKKVIGKTPHVSALVENRGTLRITNLKVKVDLLNEKAEVIGRIKDVVISEILAGKYGIVKDLTFTDSKKNLSFTDYTNVVVRVQVDPLNDIFEDFEDNNLAYKLATVTP